MCFHWTVSIKSTNYHEVLTAERLEQSDDDEQKAEQREVMSQLSVLTEPNWETTNTKKQHLNFTCILFQQELT